jgi:hypothetical protein
MPDGHVFGHIRMANHLTVAFVGWIPPVADQEGGRLLRGFAVIVSQNVRMCGGGRFPSRFHLPYPDRDHTSQSLLAERLSTSILEPIAQQLISLITDIMATTIECCWCNGYFRR